MLRAVKLQHRLIKFGRALMKFTLTAQQSSIESIDMQSDNRPYDLHVNARNANVCGLLFRL